MLPRHLFERETAKQQVIDEGMTFNLIEKVEFDPYIKTYILGAEYHQKGFAPAESLVAINNSKKMTMQMLFILAKPYMIPAIITFIFWSKKRLVRDFCQAMINLNIKNISPFFLKDQYMTPFAREMKIVITNFFIQAGVKENLAINIGKIYSHIFEYDNAYRYRLEDLFNETTKEKLTKSPIREVIRLGRLGKKRNGDGDYKKNRVGHNTLYGAIILSVLLLSPFFRRCFKFAFSGCEFKNLQPDEVDEYWFSMRTDYDFFGEDVETRSKRNIGKKIPRPVPLEVMERIRKGEKVNLDEI